MTGYELSETTVDHRSPIVLIAGAVGLFAIAGAVWAFFLGEMLILKGIAIATAIMVAALIFVEPLIGLCLFLFLVPTENMVALSGSFTVAKVVGVLAFASFLVHVVSGGTRIRFDRQVVWIFAFACWCGLSFFWSHTFTSAFFFFGTVVQIGFFWVLMRSLVQSRGALLVVCLSFLVGTLAALAAALVFPRLTLGPRMVYAHGNPNQLARDVVIGLILLLYFIPDWRPRAQAAGVAVGVVLLFSLALTQSRGSWAGAAITIPILFRGRGGGRSAAALAAMAGGAVVLVGTGLLAAHLQAAPLLMKARWRSMFQPEAIRVSRMEIWQAVLRMALHHPVLGVGAGNFIRHMPETVERMESFSHPHARLAAHNSFIDAFAELGILGLLLLAGVLMQCFRAIRRHPPAREKMLALALFVFALAMMVASTAHYQKSIWYALVLGQIVVAREIFRTNADDETADDTG